MSLLDCYMTLPRGQHRRSGRPRAGRPSPTLGLAAPLRPRLRHLRHRRRRRDDRPPPTTASGPSCAGPWAGPSWPRTRATPTVPERVARRDEVNGLVPRGSADQTGRDAALARLQAERVPAAPVLSVAEAARTPTPPASARCGPCTTTSPGPSTSPACRCGSPSSPTRSSLRAASSGAHNREVVCEPARLVRRALPVAGRRRRPAAHADELAASGGGGWGEWDRFRRRSPAFLAGNGHSCICMQVR